MTSSAEPAPEHTPAIERGERSRLRLGIQVDRQGALSTEPLAAGPR